MPTQNQNSTRPDADWDSKGKFSDKAAMKELFSGSPVFTEEMSPEELRKKAVELLLRGTVSNGYGFSSFSRDYDNGDNEGPTDYSQPSDTSGGNPASAHVPNPASPVDGANNYSSIPSAPDGYGQTIGDTWGTGEGASLSPKVSSDRMSASTDNINSSLVKGKSPQSVSSGS